MIVILYCPNGVAKEYRNVPGFVTHLDSTRIAFLNRLGTSGSKFEKVVTSLPYLIVDDSPTTREIAELGGGKSG